MDWVELISASRLLAAGQPSQEALRRAVSTAYYAMFHALATSNADLIVGARTSANESETSTPRPRRSAPWSQSQPSPAAVDPRRSHTLSRLSGSFDYQPITFVATLRVVRSW